MFTKTEFSIFNNAGLIYSTTQNGVHTALTDIPTGDLDLERLINDEPKCWRLPVATQDYKRKKIIITDLKTRFKIYTCDIEPARKTYLEEFELWNMLLSYDFEIYAWTGSLVHIKNVDDLFEHLFLIEPIKTSHLIEKIKDSGFNKDECFFATTENSSTLFANVFINNKHIYKGNIGLKHSYKIVANSLLVLMSLPHHLLQAYLDTLDLETGKPFTLESNMFTLLEYDCSKFLKKIAYLNPQINIQRLKPGADYYYDECAPDIPEIPTELAPYIKSFSIHPGTTTIRKFTEQQMFDFFGSFKCIEDLELCQIKIKGSNVNYSDYATTFHSLKSLKLKHLRLCNSGLFSFILNNSPNLEELILEHCEINMDDFRLGANVLKSLKKLTHNNTEYLSFWDNTDPDTDLLTSLLKATESLEQLQVEVLELPKEFIAVLEPSRLKHLRELNIMWVFEDDINFIKLCSNLESLIYINEDEERSKIKLDFDPDIDCESEYEFESSASILQNQIFLKILNQLELPRLRNASFIKNGKNIPIERFPVSEIGPEGVIDYEFGQVDCTLFNDKIKESSMIIKEAHKTNYLILLTTPNKGAADLDSDLDEKEDDGYFDGKTGPADCALTAVEYFRPKKGSSDVSRYRLDTFQFAGPGKQLSFIPIEPGHAVILDIPLVDDISTVYNDTYQNTDDVFLGTVELFPKKQGKWIKLPSFTPDDTIFMASKITDNVITIRKSANNFHYVHVDTCEPVVFQFLLKTPEWAFQKYERIPIDLEALFYVLRNGYFDNNGYYTLAPHLHPSFHFIQQFNIDQKVYFLSSFCRNFSVEELSEQVSDQSSLWELFNQVIREQKGSCRHRAKAFTILASIFGIRVELDSNDCHQFVHVWYPDKGWRALDLGGAEAQLNLIKAPEQIAKKQKNEQVLEPDNHYIRRQWQKSSAKTFEEYCTELLTDIQKFDSGKKNILVSLKPQQVEGFLAHLQVVQHNEKRGYIYIDHLDNIRTSEVVLGANGEKHKQDSGLIRNIKKAKPGDVLVVNQIEMKTEHIVYNTMMDTQQRMLKETDLPEGLILISLQPENRSASEDVHSRYQLRSKCPRRLKYTTVYPSVVKTLDDDQQKLLCINIYFPDEYKQQMTVRLACNGPNIHAIESQLITALKRGHSGVVIRNAPWNAPGFRLFLGEMIYSRRFEANGHSIDIPADFSFVLWDKPYEVHLDYFSDTACSSDAAPSDIKILNNLTFKSFFELYTCKDGVFNTTPGWIERYKGSTLSIVLSHELSNAHSALLSEQARRFSTQLQRITLSDNRPNELAPVIVADDLDLAEALHFSDGTELRVIPVSEMTNYSDLIERYARTESGEYQHSVSCVAKLLLDGTSVVLKGNLSPLLEKQLESLLLPTPYLVIDGQHHEFKAGQFKLLTTNAINGNFFQCHTLALPTPWVMIEKQFPDLLVTQTKNLVAAYAECLPREPLFSYIQLQAILMRLKQKPYANPLKPILRLKSNYDELQPIVEQIWDVVDLAKEYLSFDSYDTTQLRIDKVLSELRHSSYIFVAGASGSGKSTLFFHQLERLVPDTKVFGGLDKINLWLQSDSPRPFLVVEEANLLNKDAFAFLELLFQKQQSVLVNGEIMPISSRHKIIFIGNFGYFKDRTQQAFFSRHGHIITFKELPDVLLKQQVLLPILSTQPVNEKKRDEVAGHLLQAYKKMRLSLQDTITTRNLEMLAWRFLNNVRYGQENDALCLAVYDEFQIFFTESERPVFLNSLSDYKAIKAERKNAIVFDESDFFLASTRRNPLRLINQFLQIREQKMMSSHYFTGVQGVILEGDSAEGKSSLLKHYLDANDFVLATEDNVEHKRRYYVINDLESLEPVLYQAFNEGALVIINELNTMPVELLLNQYMSGLDKDGKCATKMGFAVLATQNPISFDFRKQLSAALLNRFQKIVLKEYKPEEIKTITKLFCENEDEAQKEADKYISAREHAKSKGFLRPNVRELINICGTKRKAEDDVDLEPPKRGRFI
ncbi:hypothetical protein [uncultured Legionella sp.]|mgnify:CR=1 FL=1|uniref:hypothetical protein n=1 Tax=uncultured Legionella sp. TaxID=210934 RepID=UPI0026072DC8|nr:hypothetical protein [uncultured Legionella sp.]